MYSAQLVFEDGTIFSGKAFGETSSVAGEVVFYTGMVGYPESLTDPSYTGQILVPTYPLVGNYGVPDAMDSTGLHKHYESHRIHASGLVVAYYAHEYSHWDAVKDLVAWLKEYGVSGLFGVDTRAITQHLRQKGSMLGKIVVDQQPVDFYDPNQENLVAKASCTEKIVYGQGDYRVLLIDCGIKYNTIRALLNRGATVIRVPWDFDPSQEEYDAILLSNGPGNPTMCEKTVAHVKKAMQENKPIMGICLGNQLLALAAGAKTYKLKYGHRSHNQPVLRNGTNNCFITAQNHGYAIDDKTLPDDWEVFFTNVNDETNEGIQHKHKPFFSVQFHPEAASGPTDTSYLFDHFLQLIHQNR